MSYVDEAAGRPKALQGMQTDRKNSPDFGISKNYRAMLATAASIRAEESKMSRA